MPFTGYPATLLGTNYCLMARASQDVDDTDDQYSHSQFAIVAAQDGTTVTITPSATANLAGHTNAYAVFLNQGETYQINSSDKTNDVTGTTVVADKPIAVFAGAGLTFVPAAGVYAANPLVQEQLPVDDWGRQALSVGFAGRSYGDTYRVLAAYSNTVVTITTTNGTIVTNLAAGTFCDTNLDGPVEFQGSQPIQVAHFANGEQFDADSDLKPDARDGDPCEILLPPTGHYLLTNTVVTMTNDYVTGDFYENFLNVIVAQSAITNTLVDGSTVAATNFVAIGSSGYYGAQITITNSGAHTVSSSQPVGVEVYGWGLADAYGYFGGVVK